MEQSRETSKIRYTREQVGEKKSTVCTHRYTEDCLLKTTSTKDNKYVVNQKLEHVDDINFKELFGRISVFLQNKICPFLAQGGVCQMLHQTAFQIINMYSIGGQNRASELL
jgi:bisphosphoglycerate-dependent phosphoglycerate mutase